MLHCGQLIAVFSTWMDLSGSRSLSVPLPIFKDFSINGRSAVALMPRSV